MYEVWSLRPNRTWREVVEKDCQACKLNEEDRNRWMKFIKDVWCGWMFLLVLAHLEITDKGLLNGCVCVSWSNNTGKHGKHKSIFSSQSYLFSWALDSVQSSTKYIQQNTAYHTPLTPTFTAQRRQQTHLQDQSVKTCRAIFCYSWQQRNSIFDKLTFRNHWEQLNRSCWQASGKCSTHAHTYVWTDRRITRKHNASGPMYWISKGIK